MKKRFFAVCFYFTIGIFFLSATTFLIPRVLDVRSAGMGGSHLCDFNQPFVLLSNPSGMMFSGKQIFLPSFGFDVGGTPAVASQIFSIINAPDTASRIDILVELLKKSNGIFIDMDMMLPLTFSRVGNNWGIGVYNNIFLRGDLPSVTSVSAVAGGDLMLAGGYAFPLLNTDLHKFSLGVSSKFLGRFNVNYSGTATGIASIDFKSLPTAMALATGFDVGISYTIWNVLSISAVWKNLYFGMNRELGAIASMSFSNGGKWDTFIQSGDLALGLGVRIPTGVLKKVLSSCAFYLDYNNVTSTLNKQKAIFLPHPLLNLSAGLEVILFKTVALRFGMVGPYLNAGSGFDLGPFHLSMSIYGKEKGLDPGKSPQIHGAVSLSFYY